VTIRSAAGRCGRAHATSIAAAIASVAATVRANRKDICDADYSVQSKSAPKWNAQVVANAE